MFLLWKLQLIYEVSQQYMFNSMCIGMLITYLLNSLKGMLHSITLLNKMTTILIYFYFFLKYILKPKEMKPNSNKVWWNKEKSAIFSFIIYKTNLWHRKRQFNNLKKVQRGEEPKKIDLSSLVIQSKNF